MNRRIVGNVMAFLTGVLLGALILPWDNFSEEVPAAYTTTRDRWLDSVLAAADSMDAAFHRSVDSIETIKRKELTAIGKKAEKAVERITQASVYDSIPTIEWHIVKSTEVVAPVIEERAAEPGRFIFYTKRHGAVDLDDLLDGIDEVLEMQEEEP